MANSRKPQTPASDVEQATRAADLRTQGRKGCKAARINMAFTPENHEFLKTVSAASGYSMTELTNSIVTAYRLDHPELLERARDLQQSIRDSIIDSHKNEAGD